MFILFQLFHNMIMYDTKKIYRGNQILVTKRKDYHFKMSTSGWKNNTHEKNRAIYTTRKFMKNPLSLC